jgi:hypothetical protein
MIGFFFREHRLRPPITINYESVMEAFRIFSKKDDE